jgi:Tol biopolymer transport system component
MTKPLLATAALVAAIHTPAVTAGADGGAHRPGGWAPATPVVEANSAAADGCPIESPDGRSLFFASTRPGGLGGNDIWVAHRRGPRDGWGTPERLAEPVNSTANDFCPTPLPGRRLLFVSERAGADTCNAGAGSGDIYATRLPRHRPPSQPQHLGCVADGTGPNFDGPEFSPSLVTTRNGRWLYFSSTGYDANMDLYVSRQQPDGTWGPPAKIVELSTPADDRMPNVSRDGLMMVFVSNRTDLPGAIGGLDVYVSTRTSTADPWSTPRNLGPDVNSVEAESRPSLSADGLRLYFGRLGDIWVATRTR